MLARIKGERELSCNWTRARLFIRCLNYIIDNIMKEQLRYLIPIMICQIPVMFMQLKNDRFIQVIKGVKDLL